MTYIITWLCGFWREMISIFPWQRATYARRQVISCLTKASACHNTLHANHWHCLLKIIAVKNNVTTFIQILRIVVNMFYCGRVAFTVFKHTNIKGVGQRLTSTTSLDDGYYEAKIPFVKGTTWRNNGRSTWNGSRFEHTCAFYVEIINIHSVKLKMSCNNRDYSQSVRVCCHNALGLVRTVHQIPRELTSCFARAIVHCDNKSLHPEPILITWINHLNIWYTTYAI